VNRAQGAYEAGNTYREQQQVAALTRYADLEAFDLQVLLGQIAQLKAAYSQSGFQDFSITVAQATQFELGIAANGLLSDLQTQLTTVGIDSDGLNFVQKVFSSLDPNTVSGDILQNFVPPSNFSTTIQQLAASFITPFSSFSPKVVILECPSTELTFDVFQLVAPFALGSTSNGINPANQDVSFSLGALAVTIPAGSFRKNRLGDYEFAGVINGVGLVALITPTSTGYQLRIDGLGVNLTTLPNLANPMSVGVQIGSNGANASVTANYLPCL
jgi:hypothetical protein